MAGDRHCASHPPSATLIYEKRNRMFKNINVFKLIIYILFTIGVLANSALIFAEYYTPENRSLTLSIFVIAVFILVILPTYYLAKTKWLQK
jgi:hypothetical protein